MSNSVTPNADRLRLPVEEVREGDVAVGLAGFRPITRVALRPRKRTVEIDAARQRWTFPLGHEIEVRRRTR